MRSSDEIVRFHKTPALLQLMELENYISGYVDGEGCFCVSFQPSVRHRLGWEVRPSFSVSQNSDRAEILYLIKERWDCGSIRPDRSDKTLKFEVRNIKDLNEKVIPHFKQFPLRSSKRVDSEYFGTICQLVSEEKHLEKDGFIAIVETAMKMNTSGKRKYSVGEILNSLKVDERIVYALGN